MLDSRITLGGDEAHHLARVLRLREGDRVFVFNGAGEEWECAITRIGKNESDLSVVRQLMDVVESPLELTLAQALIKGDKFDWVVQKATELGVTRIVPLITDHGDVKRAEERAEHRLARWRRIALEAVKQCGRRRLVEIAEPISFVEFSATTAKVRSSASNLIFSERGGRSLREIAGTLREIRQLSICVASEGGWSDAELQRAEANYFLAVHLGSRILRTETAAVAAVALAQHLFGDLR